MQLTNLPIGKTARIIQLNAKEIKRRRFLDLGLVPGTVVVAKRRSPSGDPTAFLIRGTTIALRKEETDLIIVQEMGQKKII
ncbi:FeoA family protein [Selenihalanaerobacter shriftii]|uniref:Ferrous iron transport protein A n=1 Tax=Selenihalanaerobacter shriftii TaxID=142842 RepID=A0A1T4PPU0_9FIRM|nr:FeoA family protein [Selenihalanaerobacter shriftii]SJZ93595.1 ferrous iron transport protein A [Selenihalanaerobacter shriftii]